ncbi:MAG: zinc-dependent peptidase [Gemmataceae bacterium]|nr:zinc-dependent peptidase [Gemmataceae bacterium]
MLCCWICAAVVAPPGEVAAFEPTRNYRARQVEGWTALVHPGLAKDSPELLDKTLALLGNQLYQIDRMVPKEAVAKLRRVKVWIENFDKHHACMCYHPDPGWLRGKKLNPDKAKGIEIANPTNFLKWTKDQPWMVFHELAHAYHDQVLDGGFRNKDIAAALARATESKKYEAVLHINGRTRKHYALTNPMEYFAEASEAYFGANDFFPFVRSELKQHDPEMHELLGKLWGVR